MNALLDHLSPADLEAFRRFQAAADSYSHVVTEMELEMNQTTQLSVSNKPTFEQLMNRAVELGTVAGKGKDTQVQFALSVFEAAYHGLIDLTENKHGQGVDDAQKLTEAYVMAQGSATVFDAKASNQRKSTSWTRTYIKAGMWPKGGTGEPLYTANTMVNIRQKLRSDPANAKKLCDANEAFLKFCRTLVKRDQVPDSQELRGFCFKKDPNVKTEEDILVQIRNLANAVKTGKAVHKTVQSSAPEYQTIINACTKRLKEMASKDKGKSEPAEKAEKTEKSATTSVNLDKLASELAQVGA